MRIRTRLLLLIVLATFPLAAVQLYNELSLRAEREREVRRGALATARLLSYDLERLVRSVELLLASMSHSGVSMTQPETCNSYMQHLAKSFPLASNIGISDAKGRVLCLNQPFAPGLHNGDRLYFRRAVQTRGFSVGEFMIGRATGRRVLAFAMPIFGDGGNDIVGVAYASINLDLLAEELLQRPVPPNSSITITDASGTVLVRSPGREHVGKPLPESWHAMLQATAPGVLEDTAIFGDVPRIVAYTPPLPPGELMVAIGLDARQAMQAINAFTTRTFLIMALALLGSIALTLLLGRYSIRKPLERILVAANRWKAGDFSARIGLHGKRTEFMEIGQTFDDMARTLGAHEADRDAAEVELRRSRDEAMRASASKTQFLASASHDLRQPLQTLSMTVALLESRYGNENAAQVAILRRAVSSLSDMVDGMMDVAQLDAGLIRPKVAAVDLGGLCRSLIDECSGAAAEKGLELVARECEGYVWSDAILLGRVLRNLLSNALKFTPPGGRIELSCRESEDRVEITVSDTGIGIPPEKHTQIFEEFQQLNNPERDRRKGLGLGLSIVRKLADLLDHPVTVHSEPGQGSAFTIAARKAPPCEASDHAAPTPRIRRPLRILLVEDDELVAESTAGLLQSWGAQVSSARSAEDALRLARGAQAAFEVALVDYRLPDRSGLEVVERLRAQWPGMPAVLVTGEGSAELAATAEERGIAILRKPILPERLAGLLSGLDETACPVDR